jgi:hypothetical protein
MKLGFLVAVSALVFGFAGSAFSGLLPGGPPAFTLDIASSAGGDAVHVTPTLTANPNGTYSASGQASFADSFTLLFDFVLNPDPAVSGSFTLTNASAESRSFSVSATLGVLPVAGPTRIGGSYGETTYTDENGDSTVTLSASSSDPFYRAQIDGIGVVDLGSFDVTAFGGPGVFGTISPEIFGPNDVGPAVSGSIGVTFPGFTLTAGDKVHVPFEFVVVPEPAFTPTFASVFALIFLAFVRENAFHASRRGGRILPTGG